MIQLQTLFYCILLIVLLFLSLYLFLFLKRIQQKEKKEIHPKKKSFKKCNDFRVIRKEIWKAYKINYKPVIKQIKPLEQRKKALNERIRSGETGELIESDKQTLIADIERWMIKREKAARKVFSIANSFISSEDLIDLHGLFVNDALKIMKELIPKLKQNKDIITLRVSCGLGKHNGLGYSKIAQSLMAMLRKNNVTFWNDSKIGFVKINMKTVPDVLEYDIRSYQINTVFDEYDETDENENDIEFGDDDDLQLKED